MRTLILTQSMQVHKIRPWQEAATMLFNGKVKVLQTYDEILGYVKMEQIEDFEHLLEDLPSSAYDGDLIVLRVPAVMTLKRELGGQKHGVKFSRQNLYTRDGWKCQYCGVKGGYETLTYDHVIPRAQGGKTDWRNVCAACVPCNRRKANRTPEEAGMKLLHLPYRPKSLPLSGAPIRIVNPPAEWAPYLGAAA